MEPDAFLAARAKRLYADRRRREKGFGVHARLFGEPAWDLLLDLFVAWQEGKRISVSSASTAACVPPTTALRWIGYLVEGGIIQETADPSDGRRRLVELTPRAIEMMRTYLAGLGGG